MYSIAKTSYGVKVEFGGFLQAPELAKWVAESKALLERMKPGFGVFVDMRTLKPLSPDAQQEMQAGQKLYKEKGMTRSVVILDGALTTLQFRRIAQETGIDQWERYIDAQKTPDYEARGIAWLTSGKEPE